MELLSYLNRVKNTLDQKTRIPLINALIFSHINYCCSIWGKCSEKLQYEVQKCINFAAKVASVGLFTVYFIFLQKYLYNKYSLIYIYMYVNQY